MKSLVACGAVLLLVIFSFGSTVNSQAFDVHITTDPPQLPYQAAIWIGMICDVSPGAVHPVEFEWTFHCLTSPEVVHGGSGNFTDANLGVVSVRVQSTPTTCLDMAVCAVQDAVGMTAQATWLRGSVTGVGFWGTNGPVSNNTALVADSSGSIGRIDCHTASMDSSVGRWLSSPNGSYIMVTNDSIFSISFSQGSDISSYNRFQLLPSVSLSSNEQGVYSCIIADEAGVEQILHIGIYPFGFQTSIEITSIQRHSLHPLTISCQTLGLPPTVARWYSVKFQDFLSSGALYQMEEVLTDRATSGFSNFITFSQNFEALRGLYACAPIVVVTGPDQTATPDLLEAIHFFGLYLPGDVDTVTCNVDTGQTVEWVDAAISAVVQTQPALSLAFSDTVDERLYICNVYSGLLLVRQTFLTFFVNVPDNAFNLMTAELSGSPATVGSSYSFACLATKILSGLANVPSAEWVGPNGSAISQGDGLTLVPFTDTVSSEVIVQTAALHTSHAGLYTCRGSLSSPALTSPLVQETHFNITLQIPEPVVTLRPAIPGAFYAGTTRDLVCEITIASAVNTPVVVEVSWTRSALPVTNGGRFTISAVEVSSVPSTFLSSLTVSGLREDEDTAVFACVASVSSSSQFLTTSPTNTGSLVVSVTAPSLVVATSPAELTVLDTAPYNAVTLTCTIMSSATLTVSINFQWSKILAQGSTAMNLSDNSTSVTIIASGNGQSSQLSTLENAEGTYTYVCVVSVEGVSATVSTTATVTVHGPAAPFQLTNVSSTVTSFSTATIEWDVRSTSYTPETYTVHYGTSQSLPSTGSDTMEVSVSGTLDYSHFELGQHYSAELLNLDIDTTYYFNIVTENSFDSVTTSMQSFYIEDIPLIIVITTSGSSIAGETLTLTCTVTEEEDITGVPVVTWEYVDPTGSPQTVDTGGDFTVESQLIGFTTTLTLVFTPLRSSHAGEYTCRAELNELSYVELTQYTVDVFLTAFPVLITSSRLDFQAALPLTLICEAGSGAVAPFTYSWSSTCSGECFVKSQMTAQVSTPALRAADSGEHSCTVTDGVGNIGTAVFTMSVEGAAVYVVGTGVQANNSVLRANSNGIVNSIQCISGSATPNVGQIFGPSGQDIATSNLDPFDVTIGGAGNAGYIEMVLASGRTVTTAWVGVYTCIVPDENGVQQVILFGLYLSGVLPTITEISLTSTSRTAGLTTSLLGLSLTCSSTGSAATVVTWRKDDGMLLVEGAVFSMSQVLRDGATSTYDSTLEIASLEATNGVYSCNVTNDFGFDIQSVIHTGLQVTRDPELFIVGQTASLACTTDLDDITVLQWLDASDTILATAEGSQQPTVLIDFDPVSDSIHNSLYTCRAVTSAGNQDQHVSILVEVDPDSISVEVTPPSLSVPLNEEELTLSCIVTPPAGLANPPAVMWLGQAGALLQNINGSIMISLEERPGGIVVSNLTFNPLELSAGQDLTLVCRAVVSSNALDRHLEKQAEWDLIIDTMGPEVCTATVQLLLGEISNVKCRTWRLEGTDEKLSAVQQEIIVALQQQCNCDNVNLTQQDFQQSEFTCPNANQDLVLFRSRITTPCDESVLTNLEDWVASGTGSIAVLGNRLQVYAGDCPVQIPSFSASTNCDKPVDPEEDAPVAIIGGATGGSLVILLAIIVIVVLAIGCLSRRKKKRQNSVTNECYHMAAIYRQDPCFDANKTNTITGASAVQTGFYNVQSAASSPPPPSYNKCFQMEPEDYIKMNPAVEKEDEVLYAVIPPQEAMGRYGGADDNINV